LKSFRKPINENDEINLVDIEECTKYVRKLYNKLYNYMRTWKNRTPHNWAQKSTEITMGSQKIKWREQYRD